MSALHTVLTAVGGWIGLNAFCVALLLAVGAWRRRVEARRAADEAQVREACELTVAEVDQHLRRQPLPSAPALDERRRPSPRPRTRPDVGDAFDAITAGLGDVRAAATQIEGLHRTGEES